MRRRWLFAVGALVAALVVAVPLAWASHQFTDVPDASPFHGDIGAVREAGITSGKTCDPPGTPPTYCPLEGITREAMAAFVHRGFGRVGLSDIKALPITDDFVELAALTINIGGVAGSTQFVKLDAAFTATIESETGCPCEAVFAIFADAAPPPLGDPISKDAFVTNDAVSLSGFGSASGALTAVAAVPTGTTQTFRVWATRTEPAPSAGSVAGFASMSAVTAPFGPTGGSTLAKSPMTGRSNPKTVPRR